MKKYFFLFVFFLSINAHAQLANGSIAPDFTLIDYNGTAHNLYSYLNAGKTVFLEIFAAHCPSCWAYHQTHKLKNIYNDYGPNGTNEIMVLALEHDQWNDSNAFVGNGPAWVTQGNWLSGTPYPIFDVEDPNRGVFNDYNVTFYPIVYKICTDKIVERVLTSETETQLYQMVQDCQSALSTIDIKTDVSIDINQQSKMLVINQYQKVKEITVVNLQGQVVKAMSHLTNSTIDISALHAGVYLFKVGTENGVIYKKLYLH